MIRFNLSCEQEHQFDGWFSSSHDFDLQIDRGLLTCPSCESPKVSKSLMAPSLSNRQSNNSLLESVPVIGRQQYINEIKELRERITRDAEDVGRKFPEEARKIHYGETPPRGIVGQADREEVSALLDEGVEIMPLPELPEDAN